MRQKSQAIIALGGNLPSLWGTSAQTIRQAQVELANLSLGKAHHSPLYETPAFPAGAGPNYVNGVSVIDTDLAPQALLEALHRIEAQARRVRDQRWGQRTLDLDLLALGDRVFPDRETLTSWIDLPLDQQMNRTPEGLLLPHPRIQDRAFVLVPMADVAADWRHPILGRTVAQMCAALTAAQHEEVRPLEND